MLTIAKNIVALFFPKLCYSCEQTLMKSELLICTNCRNEVPLTNFSNCTGNLIEKRLYGIFELQEATALFFFHKNHIVQKVIHQLKYRGHENIGDLLGNWLGYEMLKSNRFKTIDVIVPVPLHPAKLKKRGYNQLTLFCKALSKLLNAPINTSTLIKTKQRVSQTKRTKFNRWENADKQFEITNTSELRGMHVLLIDDIITTGATITNCANALFKISEIKLSIAVMAYTE
ncbi:ComF family protein [Urechidicola sp. KH5]